jgi:type 1 glutamine amidotransferase
VRLLLAAALACAAAFAPSAAFAAADVRVLVLTTGTAERYVAEFAIERLEMEARRWNFDLVEGGPEDLEDLSGFDVVMFLNTGSSILDASQRDALEAFMAAGGGFVATHSAVASAPGWDFYTDLIGATGVPIGDYASSAELRFEAGHPVAAGIDKDIDVREVWYTYDRDPTDEGAEMLARIGTEPGAWANESNRSVYSAAGGSRDIWTKREFLQLMRQAIWWASGTSAPMRQNTESVAPSWPYPLAFGLFVGAVAVGGLKALWGLAREDAPPCA